MTLSAHSIVVARLTVDAQQLATAHPPKIKDKNKAQIHAIACPIGSVPRGTIEASRWRAVSLPERVPGLQPQLKLERGIFDYAPPAAGSVEWHLNFADAELFYAYGSGLFAQDEMQVAEHPILASVRESLVASPIPNFPPWTTEDGLATPVLVMGAERSCAIATRRGTLSIYGNAMSRAPASTISALVARLVPPTVSNILAIEAIPGGSGRYSPEEISRVTMTATAGFCAAISESHRVRGPDVKVIIHTGFWGCGAFGGNKRLMALLQLVCARLAQLDGLVFHAFDDAGANAYADAYDLYNDILPAGSAPALSEVLRRIDDLSFEWGSSDGN